MTQEHKGVLLEVREALYFIASEPWVAVTPQVAVKVHQALARFDAFLEDVPKGLGGGIEHLEEFNEIHRHYEEVFEMSAKLLHTATQGNEECQN